MCSRVSSPSLIMTVGVPDDDVRVLAGSSSPRGGVGTGTGAYLSPWLYADHRSSYGEGQGYHRYHDNITHTHTHLDAVPSEPRHAADVLVYLVPYPDGRVHLYPGQLLEGNIPGHLIVEWRVGSAWHGLVERYGRRRVFPWCEERREAQRCPFRRCVRFGGARWRWPTRRLVKPQVIQNPDFLDNT